MLRGYSNSYIIVDYFSQTACHDMFHSLQTVCTIFLVKKEDSKCKKNPKLELISLIIEDLKVIADSAGGEQRV